MAKDRMDVLELLRKEAPDADLDFLREGLRVLMQAMMEAEVVSKTGAAFGERSAERLTHRKLSDWTRFRVWRLLTWLLWIAVIAVVIGKVTHTNPALALLHAPIYIWHALPTVLQFFFAIFFLIIQFGALFWFLSRGGVDVYYPDDIKTRFADVWGQDHVLARVRENILYLEHPEQVEDRGGYVPGGILLWGPPGTGKTLMAEAVAGETGKPYVFVDPGAFINMFFGVGVLKVKGLFRKLRKLALRYGGVIVFFDKADSLGHRGMVNQGVPGGGGGAVGGLGAGAGLAVAAADAGCWDTVTAEGCWDTVTAVDG